MWQLSLNDQRGSISFHGGMLFQFEEASHHVLLHRSRIFESCEDEEVI